MIFIEPIMKNNGRMEIIDIKELKGKISPSPSLDEAKVFRADGQEKFVAQDRPRRVKRDIKSRNAGVGRRQVDVVGRTDSDRRHRLETFFRSR